MTMFSGRYIGSIRDAVFYYENRGQTFKDPE